MSAIQESGRGVSRRTLLKALAAAGVVVLLSSCQSATTEPSISRLPVVPRKETQEGDGPDWGDVLMIDGKPYLLRGGYKYPIPDLEEYQRRTKMEKYGRKVFSLKPGFVNRDPIGKVPKQPKIFDYFTVDFVNNKPLGGELNVFFGGMLTDTGDIYDLLDPKDDMFLVIKGKEGLEANGFTPFDCLYFTYGKEMTERYKATETIVDPKDNIQRALDFLKTLKEDYPLAQFNLIGHSLGAYLALEAARQHFDAINNLILISGPLRGIEGTLGKRAMTMFLNQITKDRLRVEEFVSGYFFELWGDKNYQKELDRFSESFVASGRRLVCITSKGDQFAPPPSAILKGANSLLLEAKGGLDPRPDHGVGLIDPKSIKLIKETIGLNLAAA